MARQVGEADGVAGDPENHQSLSSIMVFSCLPCRRYAPEILPFDQDTIEFFVNLLQFVTENLEEEGEDEKGAVDTATNLRWIEKERFTTITSGLTPG
ncbi:hypothetical protein AK812_SmicGene27919 [Symbiodinium microadriaticum]|uniref:Uncharacterized protein n=1 Tax=Symbiodinium microadriaticum TaxID=2951 RepID=A0A1Q9D5R2_SYMMI|nr:hypothetical protein AK812_SmicGene27919 [Symbiodinium microadriaticum]